MLVGMAQATGVLSVVVSGAAPAADVSTLVKQALERGWTVQVIATPSALAFFDAAEIEALTGSPVRSKHRAPGAPRSRVPDAIVVAPATFNLINQWALGVADSYALAVLAEQTGMGLPIVALPAVSAPLASRPQFARSLKALRGEGVSVLLGPGGTAPPGTGEGTFPWHLALDEAYSMTGLGGLPRTRPSSCRHAEAIHRPRSVAWPRWRSTVGAMTSAKRKRRLTILAGVVVAYVAGTIIATRQGYSFGKNSLVRCRRGHLFTTVWIPGASVKALRLGFWRLQWCPVGRHVDLVRPVKGADLTDTERAFALAHHDVPVP